MRDDKAHDCYRELKRDLAPANTALSLKEEEDRVSETKKPRFPDTKEKKFSDIRDWWRI